MTAPETPRLLSSWKEIAAFFGRDVRTVQRWEREGLPVHRRPGAGRSGVFAYGSELEAWLLGRPETHPDGVVPRPDERDESSAPREAATAPPVRRRSTLLFSATAVLLLAGVISLSWIAAAGSEHPAINRGLILATSRALLSIPRWGNVNGSGAPDLVVSQNPSAVLVFLDAGTRGCAGDAGSCADVRITGATECALHSSQISDVNGDGFDDLAVSCVLTEPASFTRTGPAYLVWGRASWPAAIQLPRDASVTIEVGGLHDDRLGTCLGAQAAPDLNGDGIADLLLGAVEAPYAGRGAAGTLFVFFGRRAWGPVMNVTEADLAVRGSRTGEGVGGPCAAGDFNGDGRQDLAVGAGEDRIWYLLGGAGRFYLIANPGVWPRTIDLAHYPAMRIQGQQPKLQRRQLALEDLDGDGRSELIVSEPVLTAQPQYRGRIGIWRGGTFAPGVTSIDRADVVLEGSENGHLGTSFDLADLDGDGMREIVASESARGALLALSPLKPGLRRVDLSTATVLNSFAPMGVDDGVESLIAIRGERIAQIIREKDGQWQIALLDPFETMPIDVRPNFADDIVLKPGIVVVGIPSGGSGIEPVPETLRAGGVGAFTHKFEDINGDGIADLMAYFQTEHMRLAPDTTTLVVTGRDRAGRYLRGMSPVRVVLVSAVR